MRGLAMILALAISLPACGGTRAVAQNDLAARRASPPSPRAIYLPRWRLPARVGTGEGHTTFWVAGSLRAIDDGTAVRLADDFTAERLLIAADLGDDGWVFVDERGGLFRAADFAAPLEPGFALPNWEVAAPHDPRVIAQRNDRIVNAFGSAYGLRAHRLSRLETAGEVVFVDPSFGVALVDGGRLARTLDGGQRFDTIPSERAVIAAPVVWQGSIIAPLSGASRTMPGIFSSGPFLVVTRDQAREVDRIEGLDEFPPRAPNLPADARDRVTLAALEAYPGLLDARSEEIAILDDQLIDLRNRRVLRTLPRRLSYDATPSGSRELATIEDDAAGWVRIRAEDPATAVALPADQSAVFITSEGLAAVSGLCSVALHEGSVEQVFVLNTATPCPEVWTPIAVTPTHVVAYQAEHGARDGGLRRVARATGEVSEICVRGEGLESLRLTEVRPNVPLFLRSRDGDLATYFAIGGIMDGGPGSCLEVRTAPMHTESLDFATPERGVALVRDADPAHPAIVWTDDGGVHWQRVPDPEVRGTPPERRFGAVRCASDACRVGDGLEVRFESLRRANAPLALEPTPYTHREARAAILPPLDCHPVGPARAVPPARGSSFRMEGFAEGVIAEPRGQRLALTWNAGARRMRATLPTPRGRDGCAPRSPPHCRSLLATEHGILLSCEWTGGAIDDSRCGLERASFWVTPSTTTTVLGAEDDGFAVPLGEGFALFAGNEGEHTGRILVGADAPTAGIEVWSPNARMGMRIDDRGVSLALLSDRRTLVRDYRDARAAFELLPAVADPASICENGDGGSLLYVVRPGVPILSLSGVGSGSLPRQDIMLHLRGEMPSACIARLAMGSGEDAIDLHAEAGALIGTYRTPYESQPIRCEPSDPR